MQRASDISRAIVLSGGGARGAYEAGVLDYLLTDLPKELGHAVDLDLVLGTSVGAIHACFLAATAHLGPERSKGLREAWLGMRLEESLRWSQDGGLIRTLGRLGSLFATARNSDSPGLPVGLFDAAWLERIVRRSIPWPEIRRNVEAERMRAVCVAATEIASGRVVLFAEGRDADRLERMVDPSVCARRVRLDPGHALASAAIPGLFPAVRIDGEEYVDGGLRLNTPLAPAVHLGADRILVIALRGGFEDEQSPPRGARRTKAAESPLFLYGRVLNALLLDHLDGDLARMRFVNAILRQGEKAFGPGFLERLNRDSDAPGRGFRIIEDLVIQPSQDPSRLAAEVLATKRPVGRLSPAFRAGLRILNHLSSGPEEDLLSFLLFDADYTETLLDLGRRDARARGEELAAFFS